MLKRSIIPAAAATVVLATVAHASLSTSPATPPSPQGTAPDTAVRRPDTAIKASASLAETTAPSQTGKPAPRVIDLPRAEATSQSYVALPSSGEAGTRPQTVKPLPRTAELPRPETDRAASPAAGAAAAPDRPRFGEEPAPERRASAQGPRAPEPVAGDARPRTRDGGRSADIRTAKWSGGEGAVRKTGPDTRAFTGTFGGCRFSGAVGPRGYTIDRAC